MTDYRYRVLSHSEVQSAWTTSLNGFADEETGDSERNGFHARVGSVIVSQNSQGFLFGVDFGSVERAAERFAEIAAEDAVED